MIHNVDTGHLTAVNSFLVTLWGFSSNEMVGKTVGERDPFKDMELNKALLERLPGDGPVCSEEHPCEGVAK